MRLGLGDLADRASMAMLVPLTFHGRGMGVLVALDRFDSSAPFSAEGERLMRAFAGSAATALATAQTVEEEQLRMSIASADQERGRWARELHDETLQGLGALQVILTTALKQEDSEPLRRAAEQAVGQLETQIAELQGLITELRPAALDDIGLEPALRSLFERTLEAHGVTVVAELDLDVEAGRSPTRLEPEIEGTVYRLVQEALSNTAKHADAERATVRVTERDGQVSIEVRDEGRGFNPNDPRRGFGLLGMRERLELTGGALEVDSQPGAGTRVSATLPARHVAPPAEPSPPKAEVA
jgi:signal transduction histidine kinase